MVVGFVSTDGSMDRNDLSNYLASHVQDSISQVEWSCSRPCSAQYAIRVWLDPEKLNSVRLTPVDVTTALQGQNVQVAAGQVGGTPAVPGQVLTATISEATLLRTPDEFGNVLLKVNSDGSQVRIKDVARVALGGRYTFSTSNITAKSPPASAYNSPRAPTPYRQLTRCERGSTNWRNSSHMVFRSSIPMTRRPSSSFRFRMWSKP